MILRNRIALIICLLLAPALSLAQDSSSEPEVMMFPGFQNGQTDDSVTITFEDPPGHVEKPSLAEKQGLFKIYVIPPEEKGQSTLSMMTVAFQKKSDTAGLRNLEDFVSTDLQCFMQTYPDATVARSTLPQDVTAQLSEQGIPYATYFTKGNVQGEGNQYLGDGQVLFFETPGGFWSISWTAPEILINKSPDPFLFFIKDMKIALKGTEKKTK